MIKKTKMMVASFAFLLLACTACDKGMEDKLMGRWQLREVLSANGSTASVDTVWYNFQTSLFMYQLYDASIGEGGSYYHCYGFNRVQSSDSLQLELISDPKPVNEFLPRTDWQSAHRAFAIKKLSKGELILQADGKEYRFQKF